ncbi:MAG: glycoside hydrolase family 10 protein [Phycisphaerales bacterium]
MHSANKQTRNMRPRDMQPERERGLVAVAALAVCAALALCGISLAQQPPSPPVPEQAARVPEAPVPDPPMPMREFRGVWVATVANIDWPSKPGLPVEQLRAEMVRILDVAASCNLNAVLLQVRPACDAIYPSPLEPWSEFLTGQSGRPPGAGQSGEAPAAAYDPLADWITEAHARGIELHAWVNPFRARHMKATRPDAASHISKTRPELVRSYDGYLWLDPGEPEARAHSLAVIEDLVRRYDIDGIHMDDYFYPYPKKGEAFPDDASFAAHGTPGADGVWPTRSDWRRENINGFVRECYSRVEGIRPSVRVGISPFGIWRPGHPPRVKGFDAYDGLYADARLWLREGWIDYIAPQLYWKIDSKEQPFAELLKWWVEQRTVIPKGSSVVSVWPGLYATRINGTKESWQPKEILDQIAATRARTRADGSGEQGGVILYSAIGLVENRQGLADVLKAGVFAEPALIPAMPGLPQWVLTDQHHPSGVARLRLLTGPEHVARIDAVLSIAGDTVEIEEPMHARSSIDIVTGVRRIMYWVRTAGGGWTTPQTRIFVSRGTLNAKATIGISVRKPYVVIPLGSGPERIVEVAACGVDGNGVRGPIVRTLTLPVPPAP